ncbi:hypothetical protein FHR71_005388 [Methylobacterium sp. RAS18]|nr:hypothetical protein [Methylobacterium sp. RAS18]
MVDEVGTELIDVDAAVVEARRLLPAAARDAMQTEDWELAVSVRDTADKLISAASLIFASGRRPAKLAKIDRVLGGIWEI